MVNRLKLYLIYLTDQLHIQANHMPSSKMYLNWGLFIPRTPGESPPYIFFSFGLLWLTLFFSAVSEKCFFPPYNSSKILQQRLKEKWSLLQLPVSLRIDFLRFYFHGSAGYVPWLYHYPWSPVPAGVQFKILRLGPFGSSKVFIEKTKFWFSFKYICE